MGSLDRYAHWYESQLLQDVMPFWEKHSIDKDYGGFFTCLLRDGRIYDTDKFVWLQARQVWTFSKLYNELDKKDDWLQIALHGATFLESYGMDDEGHWYFSLTRAGKPLVAPYNIFSDCFACMAFAQIYIATGIARFREIAISTFQNINRRKQNPKGRYNKVMTETRPTKSLALPMIMANLSLEIEPLLDETLVNQTVADCEQAILHQFYRPDLGIIVEAIGPTNNLIDSMEGRLVNPGHAIEACWFLMDIGVRKNDTLLIQKAVDITLQMLEYGWDKRDDGIFYFLDRKGHPLQQLEWDQKLWWVHLEALIATLKGYALTKNEMCKEWFDRIHNYAWSHFHDSEYGEWFGYLKRDGSKLKTSKGGKWKGCFHVPRALFQCSKILREIT